MTVSQSEIDRWLAEGDAFRQEGKLAHAATAYERAVSASERPGAAVCLKLARCYEQSGALDDARRWAIAVVDQGDDFAAWQTAAGILRRSSSSRPAQGRRTIRVAITGSYHTQSFAQLLPLASAARGIEIEVWEGAFGQYRQEILDPESGLHQSHPEIVILAVHEGEVMLPPLCDEPESAVETECRRWTSLWQAVRDISQARVIQHNFATPAIVAMGHLAARVPGSRHMMLQVLNAQLGRLAGDEVYLVDCERLSAWIGKRNWFDSRYWYLAKQAVALSAVPLLARHTAAVMAGVLGMSRKCLVLDLDNTLWGGVIGEDGLAGLRLGSGVDGEAFVAFQRFIRQLKDKGIIIAVCSKNNEADARLPFLQHPDMCLRLDDISIFVANWQTKSENLRTIARALGIGLDAMAFVDDNEVERAAVRQQVPEVSVVPMPGDPCRYVDALSEYLGFETAIWTRDDRQRTQQYQARAQAAELEQSSGSMEDFLRGLAMQALVRPFDELHLPRIEQLIGKTNQFNLTTRRYGLPQLRAMMEDPQCVHLYLRLRDRFTDHGLVAVLIGSIRAEILEIDTWLMSCRVLGRTVEAEMLRQVCRLAAERHCHTIRGIYIPTPKNEPARDVYARFNFAREAEIDGAVFWTYDLRTKPPIRSEFITVATNWESQDECARAIGVAVSQRVS